MKITDLALVALATARLMRLLSQDMIGEWLIVRPAKTWATKYEWPRVSAEIDYRRQVAIKNKTTDLVDVPLEHEQKQSVIATAADEAEQAYRESYSEKDPYTWQAKVVSGLECPYCASYWVGAGVLLSGLLVQRHPVARSIWRFVTGTLALNYLAAHTSSRLDV